jgi:hypothetical protein
MKIGEVELEYFIDYIGRSIHLLDLSNSHYRRLLNAIGPELQNELIEKEHLLQDVLTFDWICYSNTGLIMEYKNYSLVFVSKNDKRLHRPFVGLTEPK